MESLVPAAGVYQAPDINAFVLQTGRLPKIGDPVAPWRYRGWLLYQVQFADSHPKLSGRWAHYMRTLESGHLLKEPIPRIEFVLTNLDAGRKMLERCLRLIHQQDYSWASFNRLVDWLAWGLAVSREMPPLKEETQEALYRSFNLEPLLLNPHDYLGWLLAERHSNGWNPNAFFPTPHPVVEFMVQLTLQGRGASSVRDPRLETVLDPCVGTGRMLLHASNYSYCLYGCDIDPVVAMITRINGALYAPWLAFPFPQQVLGVALPPQPPAPLPVPEQYRPAPGETLFRCDDHGQGLLFE
jgi:Type I restriction-modification system methyltransferase subunit